MAQSTEVQKLQCGGELGYLAIRALLVATQRDLLTSWSEDPQNRGFPWTLLHLASLSVCTQWREGRGLGGHTMLVSS